MVVTTVPAKKKELLKSQLLGLVELPEGLTPFSQASKITCTHILYVIILLLLVTGLKDHKISSMSVRKEAVVM